MTEFLDVPPHSRVKRPDFPGNEEFEYGAVYVFEDLDSYWAYLGGQPAD